MPTNQLVRIDTNILPRSQLIVVFCGLAFALLISFIDQNSIGVALPSIGQDLNAANTIAWAGTSSLIANTVFQVLYGRISDIVGRKVVFLSAVGLLALGDILCGFAKTGPQLYVFRGISGVGNGGITATTMMIVSDVVTLENRGKYQGILGSCVGLGNTIGPFLAAGFIKTSTWRSLFWCICPLAVLSGLTVAFTLPPSKIHGDMRAKLRVIDYYGILSSSVAIVLLLIPISGGGTYFEWSSPMVISMITLGAICMVGFIIVEWKFALMPMMPLRIFTNIPVLAIMIQNFLFGIVYYSHLYYLPIYYQNARQYSPLLSAALIIPFVAGQSSMSIISGQYISRMKRYGEVIWSGYALWTLGAGLVLLFNRHTPRWQMVILLFIEGMGVGNVFQPTLIAVQAHASKQDRAVVISIRNFMRSLGGSLGLAMSSAVFSNVLKKSLANIKTPLPANYANQILASVLKTPDLSLLTPTQENEVLDVYMDASRGVFYTWAPIISVCLLLCIFVKDRGLQRKKELEGNENVERVVVDEKKREGDVDVEKGVKTPGDDEESKDSVVSAEARGIVDVEKRGGV